MGNRTKVQSFTWTKISFTVLLHRTMTINTKSLDISKLLRVDFKYSHHKKVCEVIDVLI